jgi:transposase
MPATVIAERIGWTRSIRVLRGRVAELRPVYLPPDPASRTAYVAGEIAQCDFWFPPIELPVGFGQTGIAKRLPVLTMVCGYSRWLCGLLVPTRHGPDLFAGWWQQLQALGAVPRCWCGMVRARWVGGVVGAANSPVSVRRSAASWARGCSSCDRPTRRPRASSNGPTANLERSFLPGRSFDSPADFNAQLGDWLSGMNRRPRRALGCAPTDRIGADRQAMLRLPPVAPAIGWRSSLRLPRDHYVRLDGNDYSVHPQVIGRRVEVVADLRRVRVFCDGQLAADHERIWASHQTVSDPQHVEAAKRLRRERIGLVRPVPEPDVEVRCLADYDEALGLPRDLEGGVA